jgi:hypothetical protein
VTDSSSRHFSLSDEIDGFLHRLLTGSAACIGRGTYAVARSRYARRAGIVSRARKRRNLAPVHLMPPGVEWTAISRTYCLGRLWRWSDSSTNAFSHLRIVTNTIDDASRRDVITALRIYGCAVNCSTTSRQSSASSLPNKITTVKVFSCSHERPTLPVTKTSRYRACHTRSVLRRSSCSTCVGAIAARAHRTAFAHGIDRDRSGAFLHVPRGHSCISVGSRHASLFVSLTTVGFSAVARRQPVRLLPLFTPGRALLPRDCPILRT